MFSLFRKNKKQLLTEGEQAHIVTAIQQAERTTSGEVSGIYRIALPARECRRPCFRNYFSN